MQVGYEELDAGSGFESRSVVSIWLQKDTDHLATYSTPCNSLNSMRALLMSSLRSRDSFCHTDTTTLLVPTVASKNRSEIIYAGFGLDSFTHWSPNRRTAVNPKKLRFIRVEFHPMQFASAPFVKEAPASEGQRRQVAKCHPDGTDIELSDNHIVHEDSHHYDEQLTTGTNLEPPSPCCGVHWWCLDPTSGRLGWPRTVCRWLQFSRRHAHSSARPSSRRCVDCWVRFRVGTGAVAF